ncbi:hypothetical protein J6590_076065 [Homalodisca vitripennis]|nr:hypothetical protein J6590_076065 [Homalodisca vitripennis]
MYRVTSASCLAVRADSLGAGMPSGVPQTVAWGTTLPQFPEARFPSITKELFKQGTLLTADMCTLSTSDNLEVVIQLYQPTKPIQKEK